MKSTKQPAMIRLYPPVEQEVRDLAEAQGKSLTKMVNEMIWKITNPSGEPLTDIFGKGGDE